jgi:peptidoglycan DL-endopeptidase CwlO
VASALVAGLATPLRAVQEKLGTGTPDAVALTMIGSTLSDVAASTGRSWQGTQWDGDAADAAAEFSRVTVTAVESLATSADRLGAVTTQAAASVARARQRLQAIVDDFEARAAALESELDEPGTVDALIEEGRRSLAQAHAVIDELVAELDGHRDAVAEPAAATPPVTPTTPMGALPGLGALGGGLGSATGLGSAVRASRSTGATAEHPAGASTATSGPRPPADPGVFGSGVEVRLPDGSTASAPNATAASAVRHALTQLGVPYDWGGTTPGVGLDCSGLTQWAYHEAGLDLPRLAQEQDVGAAVDRAALRPGDLAVWDGHVAMVVGNGLMVEAGDPVQLSPIRTTNAGQGFQGFWRPTA